MSPIVSPKVRPPALTKILATLGPATDDDHVLERLIEAGAALFRLNFSHGKWEEHKARLERVRRLSYKLNTPLTVLGDLPGPKLRIGKVRGDGIMLEKGQEVIIREDVDESEPGDVPILASDYERIAQEVLPGHRVLINDGAIRMLAIEPTSDGGLRCSVTTGGLVTTRKGLNLPDSDLSVPAVTDFDWECVDWAVTNHVDFLALSFVRKASEVETLRKGLVSRCGDDACGMPLSAALVDPTIPIIAKIETPQAVKNIAEIVDAADGIMVARGDLGVEMDVAEVPMVQKSLARAAHRVGKPVIVATQMLESMIEKPSPTRAEVSDVANAILDGADCVMLSGETAVGKYPILAVETMFRVARATEAEVRKSAVEPTVPTKLRESREFIPALAHGAWHMANDIGAELMVIWSQRGGGARYLSRHNFHIPILAFSSNGPSVRRMNLLYAVFPVLWIDVPGHRSEFAELVDRMVLEMGWVEKGAPIVLLGGKPLDAPGSTNTVAIRRAGELTVGEARQQSAAAEAPMQAASEAEA